jgi:hypothetical protein
MYPCRKSGNGCKKDDCDATRCADYTPVIPREKKPSVQSIYNEFGINMNIVPVGVQISIKAMAREIIQLRECK